MTGNVLVFTVRSGGSITIDLGQCGECETKPCVEVCAVQGGPLVLDEGRGVPSLRWSLEEIDKGGCVECLGCELECELRGQQAISIVLPLERFERYVDSLAEPVVYKQRW
jgi:Fe-S-cluster-containing dehydrogenase component